jgi:hypothetical protein
MMIKEILPLVFGSIAKLYGVMRTVVIAGKAGETSVIVFPFGLESQPTLNVFDRANISANATFHAFLTVHMEVLVGDEMFHEHISNES